MYPLRLSGEKSQQFNPQVLVDLDPDCIVVPSHPIHIVFLFVLTESLRLYICKDHSTLLTLSGGLLRLGSVQESYGDPLSLETRLVKQTHPIALTNPHLSLGRMIEKKREAERDYLSVNIYIYAEVCPLVCLWHVIKVAGTHGCQRGSDICSRWSVNII